LKSCLLSANFHFEHIVLKTEDYKRVGLVQSGHLIGIYTI